MKGLYWSLIMTVVIGAASLLFFSCATTVPKGATLQTTGLIPPITTLAHAKYLARTLAATTPQPGDLLLSGTCGGDIRYKSYSKTGGDISAAITFNNYCGKDSSSNDQVIVAGDLAFGSFSTTKKITANAPLLTITTKDSGGVTLTTTSLGFADIALSLAVTSGAANITIGELRASTTRGTTTRSVKLTNTAVSMASVPGGGSSVSGSGRLYRAESGYTDFKTAAGNPIVFNSLSKVQSGVIELAGANNSSAVLTIVPGSPVIMTVVVNGQPLGTQLSCQDVSPTL